MALLPTVVCGWLVGNEEEEVYDLLGSALALLAQLLVLCGDADRAGVEMALAHHQATGCNQWSS